MKLTSIIAALALPGLFLVGREQPSSTARNPPMATVPEAARFAGAQLAGTVLAAPARLLRAPVGGRVTRTYFSEGQTVPAGAPLLKLALGASPSAKTAFATAPVAGDLTQAQVSNGQYVAAGTPYARLTSRGPVRVRVAATDAAQLHPGDSVHVLVGPVGLVGVVTPLTAVLPDSATNTAVLVLGRVGWPPGTAVEVVLARPRPAPSTPVVD